MPLVIPLTMISLGPVMVYAVVVIASRQARMRFLRKEVCDLSSQAQA